MSENSDVTELVKRLVSIHGEGGVCPTADDWRTIFAVSDEGPLELLNLLKFRASVETSEGRISGAAAYQRYAAGNAGAFLRAGGERLFFGRARYMFGVSNLHDWDAVILVRYPSARALAEMWLDPEFIAVHANRHEGVERSQVLVFGS